MKTVNKNDYEVFEFNGGYYGVSLIGSFGGELIYGGDSGCEDHHDFDHVNEWFVQWDGTIEE